MKLLWKILFPVLNRALWSILFEQLEAEGKGGSSYQKHYRPSEGFIWGSPRKEESEGNKAQKMPAPPTSGPNNQTSTHEKYKDSKTSSSAAHVNSKIAEGKKVALREPGEETAQLGAEPSSEAARPGNTEGQ